MIRKTILRYLCYLALICSCAVAQGQTNTIWLPGSTVDNTVIARNNFFVSGTSNLGGLHDTTGSITGLPINAVRTRPQDSLIYRFNGRTTGRKWEAISTAASAGVTTVTVNGGSPQAGSVALTIPTNTNQLTNGSAFITASGAPVQDVNGQTNHVVIDGTIVHATGDGSNINVLGNGTITTPFQVVFFASKMDTIWRTVGKDSLQFLINGRYHSILDSAGAAGSGLISLNGLTSSSQVFALGTAGTAFNIVSAGSTHTFNTPLALTSGVTNGGISNTDYTAFAGKQAALVGTGFVKSTSGTISYDNSTYLTTVTGITAGGSLTGTYPNPTITSGAVANSNLVAMAAHTYKGNNTSGSATPADITVAQLTADLNVFTTSLQGLVPTPGGTSSGRVLEDDGAWHTLSGGGAVSSVSNSDLTLTITPTTGAVVASLNLGHANTWSALQTFGTLTTTGATKMTGLLSGGINDSILTWNPSTGAIGVTSRTLNLFVTNYGAGINTIFAAGGDSIVGKRLVQGANITLVTNSDSSITISASGGGSSLPFADNVALIKNNADNTKLLIFSAAAVSTGTTRTVTFPDANITVADKGTGLGQFSSTSSAQLAAVINDEQGVGSLVFNNSPTLLQPILNTTSVIGQAWLATNAFGAGGWGNITGSVNTVKRIFTLTAHGFTVDEPLYINTSGVPIAADTTNFATMIVDSVINSNTFEATMVGTYNHTAHGKTVGSYYYVTMPAGSTTVTSPNKSQPVFFVQDANTIQVMIQRPVDFTGSSIGILAIDTLHGDVVAVGPGNGLATIQPGAVTLAKMVQGLTANRFLLYDGSGNPVQGTLTTTGSGAATLAGGVLNIPTPSSGLSLFATASDSANVLTALANKVIRFGGKGFYFDSLNDFKLRGNSGTTIDINVQGGNPVITGGTQYSFDNNIVTTGVFTSSSSSGVSTFGRLNIGGAGGSFAVEIRDPTASVFTGMVLQGTTAGGTAGYTFLGLCGAANTIAGELISIGSTNGGLGGAGTAFEPNATALAGVAGNLNLSVDNATGLLKIFMGGTITADEVARITQPGEWLFKTTTDHSRIINLNGGIWMNKDSAITSSAGSLVAIMIDTATGNIVKSYSATIPGLQSVITANNTLTGTNTINTGTGSFTISSTNTALKGSVIINASSGGIQLQSGTSAGDGLIFSSSLYYDGLVIADANLTISDGEPFYDLNGSITANRTITLPSATSDVGRVIVIHSPNTSFTWSFSSAIAYPSSGTTITILKPNTYYTIMSIAAAWTVINEYSDGLNIKYKHNISTPATGGTVTLLNNQYNIVNPSGALATLTVNLPSSPNNNDVVYIKYTQAVTAVTYGNGTVVDGITAPTAGGLVTLTFDGGSNSWY